MAADAGIPIAAAMGLAAVIIERKLSRYPENGENNGMTAPFTPLLCASASPREEKSPPVFANAKSPPFSTGLPYTGAGLIAQSTMLNSPYPCPPVKSVV